MEYYSTAYLCLYQCTERGEGDSVIHPLLASFQINEQGLDKHKYALHMVRTSVEMPCSAYACMV